MKQKIDAIKEALSFIRANWIGRDTYWQGEPDDFISAVITGGVTLKDIHHLVEATNNGEPTPVEGVSGIIKNGKLIRVRVTK